MTIKSLNNNDILNKDKILEYAKVKFKTTADKPWNKSPNHFVLRHSSNAKWYALIMNIKKRKLGLNCIDENEYIDIMNIKCDPIMIGSLLTSDGFLPAYHMNKTHWITIVLDGSIPNQDILNLLNLSFEMTK